MLTPRGARETGTVLEIVIIVFAPVVIVVGVRRTGLLCVDDLDDPAFAHCGRHRPHNRRERSEIELVCMS